MSGKIDLSLLWKKILSRQRKTLLIVGIVILLYAFVMVMFKLEARPPKTPPPPKQYSHLDLMQFIRGFRNYRQEFTIEDVFFTRQHLSFTIRLIHRPKAVFMAKQLAMDMLLGLIDEYPELETITVGINSGTKESMVIYGKARFIRDPHQIRWDAI